LSVETLETPRLLLEPWAPRHRAAWRRICRDPEVMRYIGPRETWGRQETDEVFDRALAHWREHGFGWRSALERTSGEWLGLVGLNYAPPGAVEMSADEVEIGWWIVRRAWGRGLATEGAAAIRDEGFGRVGLPRIIARLQMPNVASARVAEKIGMRLAREATGRHGEPLRIYLLQSTVAPVTRREYPLRRRADSLLGRGGNF
jgi:RimJ/RimL family protein N-acetyltransferase